MDMTQLPVDSAATGIAHDEVLAAATDSEEEVQSAQVLDSVAATGSTYLVVVRVEASVMVVVCSSDDQSPQVVVSVETGFTGEVEAQSAQVVSVMVDLSVMVVVGSTGTLDSQSPQVSLLVAVGSTGAEDVASQSPQVSVLVAVGSTGAEEEVSQSPQVSVLMLTSSTGVEAEELLVQSAQVCSVVVEELEVVAGSTATEVVELQSSQRNELEVVVVRELVVAAFTGVLLVVVVVLSAVAFQSTQVLRATL